MTSGVHSLTERTRWPHHWAFVLLAGIVVAAVGVLGANRAWFSGSAHAERPALQHVLDGLVTAGDAPGVTAYVAGPRGTWAGAAGVADVAAPTPMAPDARMRIESNSKTWLVALILQLAQESKLALDDTAARWLPGMLRDHGSRITIRELLHDTSGLIDDNDVYAATPSELRAMFARVGDARVRRTLLATAARARKNPFTAIDPSFFIQLAAWQPLVASPGTTYHHSNIGWNVAGLIAAKAGGKPLPVLYRERLFEPLQLHDTVFSPQGPIDGRHARGYARGPSGQLVDTTNMHPGKFADGAIVTNAKEEATFLRAAMDGTLFRKQWWLELYGLPTGGAGCGTPAYVGEGAGDGYRSYVLFSRSGDRVAVLLLNRNKGDAAAAGVRRLFCGS